MIRLWQVGRYLEETQRVSRRLRLPPTAQTTVRAPRVRFTAMARVPTPSERSVDWVRAAPILDRRPRTQWQAGLQLDFRITPLRPSIRSPCITMARNGATVETRRRRT